MAANRIIVKEHPMAKKNQNTRTTHGSTPMVVIEEAG